MTPEPSPSLSARARCTTDSPISDLMARALAAPDLVSLAAGFVDHATLPVEAAQEAATSLLADPIEARRALQYGTTRGDLRFRERLIERLEREEGLPAGALEPALHRLVVTSGSQQLLYLVAEALIDPGDIVLVESPTYFVFLGVLKSLGARTIGVETDSGGLRVEALETTLARLEAAGELDRVKLIYSVTEHSNPTGLSLAAERRPALVEAAKRWSKRGTIYVLEDAAYRGLTFEGDEAPGLWRYDPDGQTVILARTFSKTFSPGLKTGYGFLPESLLGPVLNLKGNHDFGSNHFTQQLLERVVAEGSLDRQVERLRAAYRAKRDVLLEALDEHLGPRGMEVSWTRPKGGLYVWLTLPEGVDSGRDGPLFPACVEAGVLYVPGEYAFASEPGPVPRNFARLTYGVPAPPALREGVRRLAAALERVAPTRKSGRSARRAMTAIES